MAQVMALGAVSNLGEIREVVRNSFPTVDYMPEDTHSFDVAYGDYLKISQAD